MAGGTLGSTDPVRDSIRPILGTDPTSENVAMVGLEN